MSLVLCVLGDQPKLTQDELQSRSPVSRSPSHLLSAPLMQHVLFSSFRCVLPRDRGEVSSVACT